MNLATSSGPGSRPWRRLALVGATALLALSVSTGTALAQDAKAKAKARRIAKKASVSYDLGNFDEAITLFKEAYETYPFPNFLFNIGQSYRQQGDCKNAIYFYKRFLSLATKLRPAVKSDVKSRIAELEETCRAAEEIKDRPPDRTMPPDKRNGGDDDDDDDEDGDGDGDTRVAASGDDDDDDADGEVRKRRSPVLQSGPRQRFRLAGAAGPAFLDIGALDIAGVQPSGWGSAGYALYFGSVAVTLGGTATLTPVPWDNGNGETGTSLLTSVLASGGLRIPLVGKLSLRIEAGVGALILSGLDEGNVFVPPGTMASGALTMFNLRGSVGAEYELTRSWAIIADPVFSFSPAIDGLREDIEAFSRFELMAGVSYRL